MGRKGVLYCIGYLVSVVLYQAITPVKSKPLFWKSPKIQIYSLTFEQTFKGQQSSSYKLHSKFYFRILKVDLKKNKIESVIMFRDITIRQKNIWSHPTADSYQPLVFCTFNRAGRITKFVLGGYIKKNHQRWIKRILKEFQVIIKPDATSWENEELDTIGKYKSHYHATVFGALKTKSDYSDNIQKSPLPKGMQQNWQSTLSEGEFEADRKLNWLKGFSFHQEAVQKKAKAIKTKITTLVSLELTETKSVKELLPLEIAQPDLLLLRAINFWSQLAPKKKSLYLKNHSKTFKNKFDKISLQVFANSRLKNIKQLNHSAWQARDDLALYLVLYPEKSAKIIKLLLANQYNQSQSTVIIESLRKAGHRQGQIALIEIMSNAAYKTEQRVLATIDLGNIFKVDHDTVTALLAQYSHHSEKSEIEVAQSAALSLGALVHSDKKNDKFKAQIISFLLGQLKTEKDASTISALLGGLGNTADVKFIPQIAKRFASKIPKVRSAAAAAFSLYNHPVVDEILLDHLKKEKVVSVKRAIIQSMQKRGPHSSGLTYLTRAVRSESNPLVRKSIYYYFLHHKNEDGVKDVLERQAEYESHASNRELLLKILFAH